MAQAAGKAPAIDGARMGQWSIGTIYNGMGQFMVIQVLCLIMLYMWPGIAMGLVDLAR